MAIERRSDFVTHVCQEFGFGAVGGFRIHLGLFAGDNLPLQRLVGGGQLRSPFHDPFFQIVPRGDQGMLDFLALGNFQGEISRGLLDTALDRGHLSSLTPEVGREQKGHHSPATSAPSHCQLVFTDANFSVGWKSISQTRPPTLTLVPKQEGYSQVQLRPGRFSPPSAWSRIETVMPRSTAACKEESTRSPMRKTATAKPRRCTLLSSMVPAGPS